MSFLRFLSVHRVIIVVSVSLLFLFSLIVASMVVVSTQPAAVRESGSHLITVYDRGETQVFLSAAATVGEALKGAGIDIGAHDMVEPSLGEELIAGAYWVNIYRARPVVVIDGAVRMKTITPYQTGQQIAEDVGVRLYPEDGVTMTRSTDFTGEGAGVELTVTRSVPIVLDLYGKTTEVRTLGATVDEMLDEKGIALRECGRTSVAGMSPITKGMFVRVWCEGKQTVSLEEPLAFETEQIFDADRLVGYRSVSTKGRDGVQTASYEIEVHEGVEVSRVEIARIVTKPATKQVEVIGIKSYPFALTKSKGAQHFTDSRGVVHRETYYDLNMRRVMQSCGQGGYYTVRIDGVKVDRDGYVIVAANYGRYPKCSIVETSVGPGKVYDTGGFAQHHPDGFDIATDWSRPDGI